jgi:uncharacterized YccA/Bax inhibitor family protein
MRSGNPVLQGSSLTEVSASSRPMTLSGTVGRSIYLLLLVAATATIAWHQVSSNPSIGYPMAIGGALGGFIFAIITSFKREWSPITAPIYAILEGLFIGAISFVFEQRFPGLVIQAVMLTFGVAFALLGAFQSRIIRASDTFKAVIFGATAAIALVYIFNMIFGLIFHHSLGFIHDSGPIGIGFSLIVTAVAALNLVIDFDLIENGIAVRAPKYMEWYSAFALTVTLVWLYIEILRLLSKLRRN